jgi:hypothetical protein
MNAAERALRHSLEVLLAHWPGFAFGYAVAGCSRAAAEAVKIGELIVGPPYPFLPGHLSFSSTIPSILASAQSSRLAQLADKNRSH